MSTQIWILPWKINIGEAANINGYIRASIGFCAEYFHVGSAGEIPSFTDVEVLQLLVQVVEID
jgi:hypothetical protein